MPTIILASEMTGCFPTIRDEGLARARGTRLLYIPTAAYGEGWEPEYERHILPFENSGFAVTMFDLEGKNRAEVAIALSRSDVVYVGGGNTFHLLLHMKASGFYDLVGGEVEQGLVYIGSSAGSVAATPDIAYAASVDDPSKGRGVDTIGLGFIDRPVLPHSNHPEFSPYVRTIADRLDGEGTMYFALDDDEAVIVDEHGPRVSKVARADVPAYKTAV
nr:Type 1 glutamine amidotransferase-like domain-containing protein [Neorhizobium tomejilense]